MNNPRRQAPAVIKIGGSVLTGLPAYAQAAQFLRTLAGATSEPIVAVVSAEYGHTDRLLEEAKRLSDEPDAGALDLLWSTGELRSVALLTLSLRAAGVHATGLNVHETGLHAWSERIELNAVALRAALAVHRVVIVPGFLATCGPRVVTLGRGGSDLSAVTLTSLLGGATCILIKDVAGYFTGDPAADATARLLPRLSYQAALDMADAGCPLVQRQAIAAARDTQIELVVRDFISQGTHVA